MNWGYSSWLLKASRARRHLKTEAITYSGAVPPPTGKTTTTHLMVCESSELMWKEQQQILSINPRDVYACRDLCSLNHAWMDHIETVFLSAKKKRSESGQDLFLINNRTFGLRLKIQDDEFCRRRAPNFSNCVII